jgi:hypothetical protein
MTTLEPTEEQETALANLLLACGSTRGCEASDAGRVWDCVRDMVLEEAAKRLDELSAEYTLDLERGEAITHCATVVRAWKGSP